MSSNNLPEVPASSTLQYQQCKACLLSQEALSMDKAAAKLLIYSTQQPPSRMVRSLEYCAPDAPEIFNMARFSSAVGEKVTVKDSHPINSEESSRRHVRQDVRNRPGSKVTRPIHIPSHRMLTKGFYYFPGLKHHGITEKMWKSLIKEMLSGMNPYKDAWKGIFWILVFPVVGPLHAYDLKMAAIQRQFREQLYGIRNTLARWDAEIFRPRGLVIRLETKSDIRTLATADLYHHNHIDDMTPLLTSQTKEMHEHLRKARKSNLGRARLVIAPSSYLKGLSKKNVWRLWDREAAARYAGKFAQGDLPKGLTKGIIATSRLWPDNETIPESIPWDQRKMAFAWRYKDADGVSVRPRYEDDSYYLAKMDVQRKKNEPVKALFKALFPQGYIVPEDFPERARADGPGKNPLGESIYISNDISYPPRSHNAVISWP